MRDSEHLVINGHPIYFERFGNGRPVVLLHGGLCTLRYSFEEQVAILAERQQVIGIEQVGHGHSADIPGPFTYGGMAEDTAEVLRRLGVSGADLIGWSDGGVLALILALRCPVLVRRLVVSGANVRADGLDAEYLKYLGETPPDKIAVDMPAEMREAYEAVSPDGPEHWPIVVGKVMKMEEEAVVLESDELAAIEAPTLVVAGDRDLVALDHTAYIARSLPEGELCILPGIGHDTFRSAADWLNPIMMDFLDWE
jgi:pimeloyl-ACP methyl ester carboxylesterase